MPDEIRFHKKRTRKEAEAIHDSLKLEMFYIVFAGWAGLITLATLYFLFELIVYKCLKCTSKDMATTSVIEDLRTVYSSRATTRVPSPAVVIQNVE